MERYMKYSHHAQQRMKQRAISEEMVNLVLHFGEMKKNTDKLLLKRQEVEELYQAYQEIIKQLSDVLH